MRWQYVVRCVECYVPDYTRAPATVTLAPEVETFLQDMGAAGWEVVTTIPLTFDGTTVRIMYTFRAPL